MRSLLNMARDPNVCIPILLCNVKLELAYLSSSINLSLFINVLSPLDDEFFISFYIRIFTVDQSG